MPGASTPTTRRYTLKVLQTLQMLQLRRANDLNFINIFAQDDLLGLLVCDI